jgi:very-short-patch-repair endonuclease
MTDNCPSHWHTDSDLWKKLKSLARQKRRQPTPAEDRLWHYLRNRKCEGVKFRRQYSIGQFIVDFCALGPRIVIEVDGAVHQYTGEEDAIRQEFIEATDFRVLRFTNDEVMKNLDGVMWTIADALKTGKR